MYVELLAESLELSASTVSFHLKKLEEAGLVYSVKEQYYVVYHINSDMLKSSLLDLINIEHSDIKEQEERQENYKKKIIDSFFEYGKLKSIPVQQKKKRIILEEIAKNFEADKVYSEKEVNIIIADIHEDFCTIRRDMVSERILAREEGKYRLVLENR